jgi:hypothetical protein
MLTIKVLLIAIQKAENVMVKQIFWVVLDFSRGGGGQGWKKYQNMGLLVPKHFLSSQKIFPRKERR